MTNRVRLTNKQKVDIINSYTNDLTPMIELADRYGITRQGIYKILKQAGCSTHKGKIPVSCTTCGNIIYRTKAKIRKNLNHFCDNTCYYSYLRAGNGFPYIQNGNGQKIAKAVVSEYFNLQQGHIVHHKDRNQLNNRIDNLLIFACQGDHIRHHRGLDVAPIWDGQYI